MHQCEKSSGKRHTEGGVRSKQQRTNFACELTLH